MSKVITFSFDDGGFEDIKVIEVLDKLGIPGTFYIPSFKIANTQEHYKLDSRSVLMMYTRHEVGSHSKNHQRFNEVPPIRWHEEIYSSRQELISFFCQPVRCFAYPYNAFITGMEKYLLYSGYHFGRSYMPEVKIRLVCEDHRWFIPISYRIHNDLMKDMIKDPGMVSGRMVHFATHPYELTDMGLFASFLEMLKHHYNPEFVANCQFFNELVERDL